MSILATTRVRVSMLATVSIAILAAWPSICLACLCDPSTQEEQFAAADLVAVARAYESLANWERADIDSARPETWYRRAIRFSIVESKKTPDGITTGSAITVLDPVFCSLDYPVGGLTLLYAKYSKNRKHFVSNLCYGTKLLNTSTSGGCSRCNHPLSAKDAIAQSDAVFDGRVISGSTDPAFQSGKYHYRVYVRTSWKNAVPGKLVDVFWHQDCGFQLLVGEGYRFFVRMKGGQLVHDECLEPRAPSRSSVPEQRFREWGRIEAEFDLFPAAKGSDADWPPASEFASSLSGELSSAVFLASTEEQVKAEASSDAGMTINVPEKNDSSGSRASKTSPPNARALASPSCSRCSLTTRDSRTTGLSLLLAGWLVTVTVARKLAFQTKLWLSPFRKRAGNDRRLK